MSASSAVIHIRDVSSFNNTIQISPIPVVVKFGAQWCMPCRTIDPVLDKVSLSLDEKILVLSVDVDELPELAKSHNLMSVPSIFVFKGGKLVRRVSTGLTPRSVKKILEESAN